MKRFRRVIFNIIEDCLRNIGGGLGERLRRYYYMHRFISCGKNLRIGLGVILKGCEFISLGDDVWIDDYCIFMAGPTGDMPTREVRHIANQNFKGKEGHILIGSFIHFAPYCLIHGAGGVVIEDFVGFSSGVKLYSMSNHYCSFKDPRLKTYSNPTVKDKPLVFVKSPIVIKRNAFISLNAIVLIGTVGEDAFVSPNAVVTKNIPDNTVASGHPAVKIKERFLNDVA